MPAEGRKQTRNDVDREHEKGAADSATMGMCRRRDSMKSDNGDGAAMQRFGEVEWVVKAAAAAIIVGSSMLMCGGKKLDWIGAPPIKW